MKICERVEYAVETPHARKMIQWRVENKEEESKGKARELSTGREN